MSTDMQRYSLEDQAAAIALYAARRGLTIVRTYEDAGKSGLRLDGRKALKDLIADVTFGRADFEVILVYDVSRWGRFQDIDESAHYEFLCKKAGVSVEYCKDAFCNDGSLLATLIKGLKRAMAGEFSRALSVKVFEGQVRLARMGYSQGGTAGFGLRRILVDQKGRTKVVLGHGQRKHLQTDRVILAPGPRVEVQAVREAFRLYVDERLSHRRIAQTLNQLEIRNERGNPWTQQNVSLLLRNERYIGNFIYNRTSLKLQSKKSRNRKTDWIRHDGAIDPIVDPEMFAAAQKRLNAGWTVSDSDLLNHLTAVWCVSGLLSCKNMNDVPNTPVANTYRARFGSVNNAFRLVGYKRTHNYRYSGIGERTRRIHRELLCRLTSMTLPGDVAIRYDPQTKLLCVRATRIVVIVLPYRKKSTTHRAGWRLQLNPQIRCDLMLVVRMEKSNSDMLDCHLLPYPGNNARFTAEHMSSLAKYRLHGTSDFLDIFRRCIPRGVDRCP